MQITSFNLSNSISQINLKKPHKLSLSSNPAYLPSLSKQNSLNFRSSSGGVSRLPLVSCSLNNKLGEWISSAPIKAKRDGFEVKATSVGDSADADAGGGAGDVAAVEVKSKLAETLVLGSLFGLWYLFNIYFNIYNKQVTKVMARMASADIMCVGSKSVREKFSGIIRQQDVRATEIDKVDMHTSFRPGDIVKATVISLGDARAYHLSTAHNELSVVSAESMVGGTMVPISWTEMQCPLTGQIEQRKVAKVGA